MAIPAVTDTIEKNVLAIEVSEASPDDEEDRQEGASDSENHDAFHE